MVAYRSLKNSLPFRKLIIVLRTGNEKKNLDRGGKKKIEAFIDLRC